MSRLTLGNVVKVGLVAVFVPLLAYLVLLIGGVKKKFWVVLEGLVYATGFTVGIFVLDIIGLGGLLALASMGVSGVRAWHLRDLWLPARRRWWHRLVPARTARVPDAPPPEAALDGADGRGAALQWVAALAGQHRLRLPAGAYVTFRETCRVLDDVVEAERREPSRDARFEYELDAMVRTYLPGVLRGYLAIPAAMVENRQPNGRTPNEELGEQLTLLAAQARTLHANQHGRASERLTTTGNFLREKFGEPHPSTLDLEA